MSRSENNDPQAEQKANNFLKYWASIHTPFESFAQEWRKHVESCIANYENDDHDDEVLDDAIGMTQELVTYMENVVGPQNNKFNLAVNAAQTLVTERSAVMIQISAEMLLPFIDEIISQEKPIAVICNYVDRLITQRDESQSAASNLQDSLIEDYQNEFYALKTKPMKGLYEAIMIKLFLGCDPNNISFDSMNLVNKDDHYQVENANLGKALTKAYNLSVGSLTPQKLIQSISDMTLITQNNPEHAQILGTILMRACSSDEIVQTASKISQLQDKDLQGIVGMLGTLRDSQQKEVFDEDYQISMLQNLVQRREIFRGLMRAPIEEELPDLSGLSLGGEKNTDPSPNNSPEPEAGGQSQMMQQDVGVKTRR
jgi:hypothetical protein